MASYYPIFLRVAGRSCLVIGGGRVAEEKVQSLLTAGARVTVISPQLTAGLTALATTDQITHQDRTYGSGDVAGFFLAYAATDDEKLHVTIAAEADAAGVLLNVVDRPRRCVRRAEERNQSLCLTSFTLATLYPARGAAKLDPAEALRYE